MAKRKNSQNNGKAKRNNQEKPATLHFVSAKRKKNVGKIIWFSIFIIFFMAFIAMALFLFFYDFDSNDNITEIFVSNDGLIHDYVEQFGAKAVFGSFGFIFAVAAWNAVGFIAAKMEDIFCGCSIASVITSVILYVVYLAGLCGLLAAAFISQKITLTMTQNAVTYGETDICGLLWLAMLLLAFISFVAAIVSRLTGASLWLSALAYILLPAIFLIVFAILCWSIAGIIADKIPLNYVNNSSSSSEVKTYTYTNSMGCESTVVSDNGRDFYDPCSNEYIGYSTDGGQTIIEK